MINLDSLEKDTFQRLNSAGSLSDIEAIRLDILGKNGELTQALKTLGQLDAESRKTVGGNLNAFKERFLVRLGEVKTQLEHIELNAKLSAETVDMSLPVNIDHKGRLHPITRVIEEAINIFSQMGFSVAEGPDIETEYNNFTALNIPDHHPARQMHDTFYVKPLTETDDVLHLLRTHTSPVQVRTMLNTKPPIRIVAPGRTYRCDSDQTHTPMFHQIEGLYIDKKENVHMGHLKYCIETFCSVFFETKALPVRFRPSFFPFTEPSAEVDIGCKRTKDGIEIGIGDDWLEVLGCGMVHPTVLKNCGIDPDKYQGFAFGMGIERLAMLKYNIPDLRTFFEGQAGWLQHYGSLPFVMNARGEEE